MKKLLPLAMALMISGGLAGCYVEDDTPDGGGGGPTVIERERTIERNSQPAPAPDVNINPPADAPDVNIHHNEKDDSTTTTTP